jgi:ABC-type phosphate transport system substrate-binding protein
MSRNRLFSAASAAALACLSTAASAQHNIQGGGSSSSAFDYYAELSAFNAGQAQGAAIFNNTQFAQTPDESLYWASGSTGQLAFLYNDITCDAQKVLNGNKTCPTNPGVSPGGVDVTHYAASDAVLSSSLIAFWSSSSATYGQSVARNLIQIPSMGTSESFPIVNSAVSATSKVTLSDSDLCGIFSGKITDWSGTSAHKSLASGPITVVYRSDAAGATFIVLNHLAAVCTTANSNFVLPITVGQTFANIFTGGVVPSNFVGESLSLGVADELSSLNSSGGPLSPPVTSAIGYVSADYTIVNPNSDAVLSNGLHSALIPAYILNGKTGYWPTATNIASGLNHPSTAAQYAQYNTNLKPPATAAAAANPANWGVTVGVTTTGYPVVGYTTFDLAQCYADPVIAKGIIAFLTDHYSTNATYATIISNNGLVSIAKSGAKSYAGPIATAILSNRLKWGVDIQDATACKGLPGR